MAGAAAGALILLVASACNRHGGWSIRPQVENWHFSGFLHPLDLSGAARASERHVLVVTDEAHLLQAGTLDMGKRTVTAMAPINLPPLPGEHGKKVPEADLEGVAWHPEDSCYYAVGSHGVGKKKGDFQESRHSIFRIPFDAAKGSVIGPRIRRASLTPTIEGIDTLKGFVHQPLQQNGLNIEGLASCGGKLWVGLRAPNVDGTGFVLEIDPAALFRGTAKAVVHRIPLGKGRGVREIAAVADGFVILAGNASAEASKKFPQTEAPATDRRFTLHHWSLESGRVSLIGRLPDGGGKAEGLMVLAEEPGLIRMLVIFDGVPGGSPKTFVLARPGHPGM